jgi:hypothetical protein
MTSTQADGSAIRICNRCFEPIELYGTTVVAVPDPDSQANFAKLRNTTPFDLCADCVHGFCLWLQEGNGEATPIIPSFSDN